jgi:hypothetical protein
MIEEPDETDCGDDQDSVVFDNMMKGETCDHCRYSQYIGFDNFIKCSKHNKTKSKNDKCENWEKHNNGY